MVVANGKLPDSQLMTIPGGRLAIDAAESWLDMRDEIFLHTGIWIVPAGPNSSYRPISIQVYFWNLYITGRGNVAAVVGTSNHGWGHAVDILTVAMASAVEKYGAKYNWNHSEGQRVGEWWHMGYVGGSYTRKAHRWYMTSEERKKCEVLEDQRNIARRHGGWNKIDKSHQKTANEAKAWLVQRVHDLASGNQVNNNRRLRRHYITAVVNG